MKKAMLVLGVAIGTCGLQNGIASEFKNPTLIEVRKIWDGAPHNAFTDLVRFNGQWYCAFREGQSHVSKEGAIRILSSRDGDAWKSSTLVSYVGQDLRDPKLSVTPAGRLMLSAAVVLPEPASPRHKTWAWFSDDARLWSQPSALGEPGMWLWRVTWHRGQAYSVGYDTQGEKFVRLYRSGEKGAMLPLVPNLYDKGTPNEATLLFADGTAYCLLRRDGQQPSAQLGVSQKPYLVWEWKDLGLQLGGPNLIRLRDGRLLAAGRLYEGTPRTALMWIDPVSGTATECLQLPSSGDNSYPGLVLHQGELWMTYYSSHEGKAGIYLAKVEIPALEQETMSPRHRMSQAR